MAGVRRPSIPGEDLYAILELPPDASFEAIEIAWRSLLKHHHPDVAGDHGLARAKQINVAHDWLSDPALRERYDHARRTEGLGPARRRHHPATGHPNPAAWPVGSSARTGPARRRPPTMEEGVARFVDRVGRLSRDELDRLALAEPPPIAFAATIRRFVDPERQAALDGLAASVRAALRPVDAGAWRRSRVRDAILAYGHELILADFLDRELSEPFRERVQERLSRGWQAAVDQPRYGPNDREVAAFVARLGTLKRAEATAILAHPINGLDEAAWPGDMNPDEDETFRVSAQLAATDAAAAVETGNLPSAAAARLRRVVARAAHLLVLRRAFPAAEFDRRAGWLLATLDGADAGAPPPRPVRRHRAT
jgi:curved DNA-binding protein CbpA